VSSILENNDAGIRTQTGTKLKNDKTGEIIYEPPQDHQEIVKLLTLLDVFLIDCILTVTTTHKSKKWVGWTVKIKTPQNIMR
jgi:hypothetical protein